MKACSTLTLVAVAALLGASGITCAEDRRPVASKRTPVAIPDTWSDFKASSNPEDRRIVAGIEKMEWWYACRDYGRESRKGRESRNLIALREYLLNFKFINGVDLMNVGHRNIAIGMTTCGVFASLGMPDKVNQTQTAARNSAQIVYRNRGIYVYTEASRDEGNGTVSAIQR